MIRSIVLPLIFLQLLLQLGIAQLSANFYQKSCPNVDTIVSSSINASSKANNVVPIAMLRLFAHDCFVEGCDGSILISSTSSNTAERDNPNNLDMPQNPFDALITAKKAVEAACPGVVSCADILAMAARDGVAFSGGPSWTVLKGRRDGLRSQSSRVNLPGENFNVAQLNSYFANIGLSSAQMVALSGAHTIGFAHCDKFTNRLYNFSSSTKTDPTLNSDFVSTLKAQCPSLNSDTSTIQALDITSPFVFDNAFFKDLQQGKGLITSDQVLFTDSSTKGLVNQFASSQQQFFQAFTQAMIKFGSVGVKTGSQGEIRKDCTKFNNS